MATEVTTQDYGPRQDPREVGQERAFGTIDLDASGAGSITVTLSGELEDIGMGLFGTANAGDGTATLANLSSDSVDVEISGGTADQVGVEFEAVLSEDGFFDESGDTLGGGSAP